MTNFRLLGSPVVAIFCVIIFIILIVRYWKSVKQKPNTWRNLLVFLRSTTLLGLLILVLDPLLSLESSKLELPSVSVFYDVSQSMKHHLKENNINYSKVQQNVSNWINENNLNAKYYYFGEEIRKNSSEPDFSVNDKYSDFTELPDIVSLNNAKINLLFSDGISTNGIDLNSINFSKQYPIYTIGFGSLVAENDVSIENVEYPRSIMKGDSVSFTISIKATIEEELPIQILLFNNEDKIIHSTQKTILKGSSYVDVTLDLNSINLTEQMRFKIISNLKENMSESKDWSINLNILSSKNTVFLVSGSLSPNTTFIKDVLKHLPQTEINHAYRKNTGNWDANLTEMLKQNPEFIVLDDFPNRYLDNTKFDEIMSYSEHNGISVLYFEGPNSNSQSATLISGYLGTLATTQRKPVLLPLEAGDTPPTLLSNLSEVALFPPQRKIHNWTAQKNVGYPIIQYSDLSLAVYQIQDKTHFITGIFMPELAATHFKLSSTKQENKLYELCYDIFLSELISEDKYTNFTTNKPYYFLGDPIEIDALLNPHLSKEPKEMNIVVSHSSDTKKTRIPLLYNNETKSFTCEFIPTKPGNLEFFTETKWENNLTSNSKTQEIIVQTIHTELRNLVQNKTGLLRIAETTGGEYNNINELDSFLNHLKISPLEKHNDYHLSSSSFYRYWWIFIVLFTAEWIIRKKIGLL